MARTFHHVTFMALAALAVGVAGCASSVDVDGIWHAVPPEQGAGNTLISATKGMPGVELVVGTYGPDLSGLVRYYRTAQFDTPRAPEPPFRECQCAFLHQARLSDTGHMTFYLDACVPGASPSSRVALTGDFNLLADGRLAGTLTVDDPTRPDLAGLQTQLTFVRNSAVPDGDPTAVACENPATLADGNTASGQ